MFALHSIHHVPSLSKEVAIMREWMRDEAVIAVDEHIQNDMTLIAIVASLEPMSAAYIGWRGAVFIKGSRRYQLEKILEVQTSLPLPS